ncbi:alginate lyase family protein [Halomarina pelagica]|uniref:alginate lyase family protein n=1 Tax=Halomarina pelagica TaxID=2961599 RepID=UPI0020C36BD0|nr:alginate lyase family protein [Halomarina sp. BND7]
MEELEEARSSCSRRQYLKFAAVAAAGTSLGASAVATAEPSDASLPTGESRPALFVHLDELAGVKRQVEAGEEPWASAYEEFIADANASLEADPRSVTDNGDGHTFDTGGPGSGTRGDYTAAIEMGDRIRDLGLAYQFTGEDRYAEKAVEFLDHWFLDPATRMRPKVTDGIELYITIPKMWYGAELVRDHPAWDRDGVGSQADLEQWTATFLETLPTGVPDWIQNIYVWREVCHAAGAAYVGDSGQLRASFDRVRQHAFGQLRRDGLLANEIERSEGLSYSMYALKAYVTMAELGRHYGQDLYSYEKYGGSAIKLMFDGYVEYVLNPDRFDEKYGEARGFSAREREEGASAYELAYSRWQEDGYLDVITSRGSEIKNEPTYVQQHQDAINSKGRPVRDERLLGWTTFSHGNLFAIDQPTGGSDGSGGGSGSDGGDSNGSDGSGESGGSGGSDGAGGSGGSDGSGGSNGTDGSGNSDGSAGSGGSGGSGGAGGSNGSNGSNGSDGSGGSGTPDGGTPGETRRPDRPEYPEPPQGLIELLEDILGIDLGNLGRYF